MNQQITIARKAIKYILYSVLLLPLSVSNYAQAQTQAKSHSSSKLTVANVLQSHMVIQQNKPFKVWGKAPAGATVTVKADWLSTAVRVKADQNHKFMAILPVPEAVPGKPTPHTIAITAGGQTKALKQLLIGDVWFLSGQSNMQFAVHEMADSAKQLATANRPMIRLLNVALNFSKKPINHINGTWVDCTPETVRKFSAVGYSFGVSLQERLNIPIGLIFSGIGASKVQAFVPQPVLAADSLLNHVYLQPYLASELSKQPVDAGFSFEKVTRPFLLYNALIHPFINLSIKGICWYQGESNNTERKSYTRAMTAMIHAWREAFRQGSIPFEFVQIAPYAHEKMDSTLTTDAYFREAQEKILHLNNTAMVSTMDVGDAKNLHPTQKTPVGIRLANVALNRTYGRLDVPYLGPQFDYVNINENSATVHFQPGTITGGLQTRDRNPPRYFTICGKDQVFYPAHAIIKGNTIELQSANVKHPVAIRYAFFNYPVTNLQNGAGIPANPFRTDTFPEKQPKK